MRISSAVLVAGPILIAATLSSPTEDRAASDVAVSEPFKPLPVQGTTSSPLVAEPLNASLSAPAPRRDLLAHAAATLGFGRAEAAPHDMPLSDRREALMTKVRERLDAQRSRLDRQRETRLAGLGERTE